MADKLDMKKALRDLYAPGMDPIGVQVPALGAFAIDGNGDPNGNPRYQACVEALFSAAYTLKFFAKKQLGRDWTVMPLEGEWWSRDMDSFTAGRRDAWSWTLYIVQPDFIGSELAAEAVELARRKKPLPGLADLRFERSAAHEAMTILHRGPYAAEGPTVSRLHGSIAERGWKLSGRHREIYLNDPRTTAPGSMKTVIRQPFSR